MARITSTTRDAQRDTQAFLHTNPADRQDATKYQIAENHIQPSPRPLHYGVTETGEEKILGECIDYHKLVVSPGGSQLKISVAQATPSTARRQRALKGFQGSKIHVDPISNDIKGSQTSQKCVATTYVPDKSMQPAATRQNPGRRAKRIVKQEVHKHDLDEKEMVLRHAISPKDLIEHEEGKCISDEDEEDSLALIEFWSQRYPRPSQRKPAAERRTGAYQYSLTQVSNRYGEKKETIDTEVFPPDLAHLRTASAEPPVPSSSKYPSDSESLRSTDDDTVAVLRYSPPRSNTPGRPRRRPATPPSVILSQSPTKARLKSPSKIRDKIPVAPFRPSLDAFWSASNVNAWNDQYSPRKEAMTSPRKKRFQDLLSRDISSDSDTEPSLPSPPKPRSACSPEKQRAVARKAFDNVKRELALSFLAELDGGLTNGRIADLTASSGGVSIKWSKSLNKTAGRATWKGQSARRPGHDGEAATVKHMACIELAEKVIDDEYKLFNTMAHEFCHLATFMISGIKDNPHGTEFKNWGRKATTLFASRNVKVTTKHSYEIDYKYKWECTGCGLEYKRHSKSIDTSKQSCGSCKSKLVQTKPAARTTKMSDYQKFIKDNYRIAKSKVPAGGHAAVMEVLVQMYRESKVVRHASDPPKEGSSKSVQSVVDALAAVFLDD